MLIKHILGRVELEDPYRISMHDEIEVDLSMLDNKEKINWSELSIETKGTHIYQIDKQTIRYNPIPYYKTDYIRVTIAYEDNSNNIYDIDIIIINPVERKEDEDQTNNPLNNILTEEYDESANNDVDGKNEEVDNVYIEVDTSNNHKPSSSKLGGIQMKENSDFMRIVKSVYPQLDLSSKINWEKEIHNYKYAIYKATRMKYKREWDLKEATFQDLIIEVKNKRMEVKVSEKFANVIKKKYPHFF